MPQVHYPFIDIAVHPAVRTHFAAGDAVVLFSRDMKDVLWANGEGARLFGHREIYDLIEAGPERAGVAFRQLAAAAAQLEMPGDKRGFVMRIAAGFKSTPVQAAVDLIVVGRDSAVMFSATPASGRAGLPSLLSGFDDDDTHMAVLGSDGDVLASSPGFAHLGVMPDTARALISAATRSSEGLVKRPIPSGSGYLPAAIGKLTDSLYLLFCVETSIGRMDAPEERQDIALAEPAAALEPVAEFLHAPEAVAPGADDTAPDERALADMSELDAPVAEDSAAAQSEFVEPSVVPEPHEDASADAVVAGGDAEEAVAFDDGADHAETEEGESVEDISDLAAIDGASSEEAEGTFEPSAVTGDETRAPSFDATSEPLAALDSADADEDLSSLAAMDGTSAEEIEAASVESVASQGNDETPDAGRDGLIAETNMDGQPAEATALAADIAASETSEIIAPLPDLESSELAADIAEASDAETAAPDALQDEQTSVVAVVEAAAPTVEDTDLAFQQPDEALSPSDGEPVEAGDLAVGSDDSGEQAPGAFAESQDETDGHTVADDTAEPIPESVDTSGEQPSVADDAADAEDEGFHFDHGARPVRFVWKLDAQGVFAEVSDEFMRTVGPRSGDIVGRSFRDLAALFDLDPEQQITGLLDRRDTWSGRTVKWPVEGTDLVVPVDLAALPTYSRSREFDGFRGFGIIRVGDAETDPQGFGLTLVPEPAAVEDDVVDTQVEPVSAAEEPPVDEFRGEVPALEIVSNPLASLSDKIIQLEERRTRNMRDGLSASEQAALKEIARQLEPFGKRPNEDVIKSSSGLLQTEDAGDVSEQKVDAGQPEQAARAEDFDDSDVFEEDIDAGDGLDEQEVQTLFEDLGTGPGLTTYAIDQVPMAILIHAGDRLIEANGEFRRLTGYATIAELEREGGLDALITRREGPDAGVYLVRADGTQVLVSARLQSVRYEGSSALMLALTPAAGTLAAVTTEPQIIGESDSAHKLQALKVEVEELHSILETATDGVIVLDTEGRIRSMNRSAAALFNFDDGDTLGKPFAMLFAHESQKSVQDYLAGLAGHGVASVLNDGREVIGREASGGFIPLFMTMGRMPGSNSYCAVIRDITQWKRSEEELRTAKRAAETANQHKSDFLARVSHEIRTPLNAIIGFSDMIANEHFGPAGHSRYVEYASDIGRSGRHVLDIVNDLLDISKIEAGEMELEFAAVGINDCISEAVSLVQPQANAQRVIIRTSLSQSVPDVVADLRSIKQIALNILANAIRYTPSGGQIVVSTAYESSGSVTLRIRDTGVGMSKAELDQAMRPFGQVASGTRQRGDGTGLGLPLTKAMTEANRATFAIHSAPNEGTLVEITFPPQRVLAD
ncbi:ATP-binding protein [Rhizobium sp.]